MNLSVEHIGLAASDPAALKNWYVQALNAREIFTDSKSPPAFLLELEGGLLIEIYPSAASNDEPGNNKLAGWRHLALRVDSIESARDELLRRGVIFNEPIKPAGGGGRVLFFKDSAGNLLHLVERSADPLGDRERHEAAARSAPP
jgi:glyoxylase I family protein